MERQSRPRSSPSSSGGRLPAVLFHAPTPSGWERTSGRSSRRAYSRYSRPVLPQGRPQALSRPPVSYPLWSSSLSPISCSIVCALPAEDGVAPAEPSPCGDERRRLVDALWGGWRPWLPFQPALGGWWSAPFSSALWGFHISLERQQDSTTARYGMTYPRFQE